METTQQKNQEPEINSWKEYFQQQPLLDSEMDGHEFRYRMRAWEAPKHKSPGFRFQEKLDPQTRLKVKDRIKTADNKLKAKLKKKDKL